MSATLDAVNTACVKSLFAKAAKAQVKAPDDLAQRVERLLARRCLDYLGLARRAGQAVAGFEKVRAWLRSGKVAVVLSAADGAEGGRAKIRAMAPGVPLLDLFSGTELGSAVGRERAVYVVVAPGGLADGLLREAARLNGFRRTV